MSPGVAVLLALALSCWGECGLGRVLETGGPSLVSAPPQPPASSTGFFARNTTRLEGWQFFAPRRHGTFFQMPTARKYALSTVYTQMNLRDTFAQVLLRPSPSLSVRVDVHRLDLMDSAARWYFVG